MLEPTPTKMSEPPPPDLSRVKLHFKAVGNAPIMRKAKFMIGGDERFSAVAGFLRDQLKLSESDRLFLYCDSAFTPSPDEPLRDLYECFGSRGELIVNYSMTGAYG